MHETQNMSSVRHIINILTENFEHAGSDAPRLCARVLVAHVLGVDSLFVATHPHSIIGADARERLQMLAQRHVDGEPLAYILGEKEFYGRTFRVNKHTLIPRPESEDVLDALLVRMKKQHTFFIDVGTGSGCLAATLAAERPNVRGIMLDKSAHALAVARENVQRLGVAERVLAVRGDLHALPIGQGSVDIIMSNPPYISSAEYATLDATVRDFEPKTALVPSGCERKFYDGLEHLEALSRQAHGLLRRGGLCIVEHGSTQGRAVAEMFAKHASWAKLEEGNDMSGLQRFFLCEKK